MFYALPGSIVLLYATGTQTHSFPAQAPCTGRCDTDTAKLCCLRCLPLQPTVLFPLRSLLQKDVSGEKLNSSLQPGHPGMCVLGAMGVMTPHGVVGQAQPQELWGTHCTLFNCSSWKVHWSCPAKRASVPHLHLAQHFQSPSEATSHHTFAIMNCQPSALAASVYRILHLQAGLGGSLMNLQVP